MATTPTRDADLVRRLHAGDRDAWQELYEAHADRLHRFGYRLAGNEHDAADLVSETFLRALPRIERLDPETADLGAYLFATLKSRFLEQVERGRRAEPTAEVPEPDRPVPVEDDPERSALLARQQEEVRIANARLPPRQRLVLALCELEDRSYAEIGELVGLSENAVAQLVFRARESLRTELRLVQVDPGRMPEPCRSLLPQLARHLDGRLEGDRREHVLGHLAGCERCQAALTEMREAKRRYRALLPMPLSTEQARAQIADALGHDGAASPPGSGAGARSVGRGRRALVVGTSALALSGLGGVAAAVALRDAPADAVAVPAAASSGEDSPTTDLGTTMAASTPPPTTDVAAPGTTQAPEPPATSAAAPPATTRPATVPQAPAAGTPPPLETVAPAPSATDGPAPTVAPPAAPRDRTAPTIALAGVPPGTTPDTTATISFVTNEPGVRFACAVDGGGYAVCSSPLRLTGLELGAHSVAVRARDRAGNVGSAAARWEVVPPPDTTAPSVTITSAPTGETTATEASVAFAASEHGATFACALDGAAFAPCASPLALTGLASGAHVVRVRATDAAGNTGPEATRSWTVVRALPDLVVSALGATSVTVRNRGAAAAPATVVVVVGVGTLSVPALAAGASATRSYPCRAGTLTATADATGAVAEADETNNVTTRVTSCLGFGS